MYTEHAPLARREVLFLEEGVVGLDDALHLQAHLDCRVWGGVGCVRVWIGCVDGGSERQRRYKKNPVSNPPPQHTHKQDVKCTLYTIFKP